MTRQQRAIEKAKTEVIKEVFMTGGFYFKTKYLRWQRVDNKIQDIAITCGVNVSPIVGYSKYFHTTKSFFATGTKKKLAQFKEEIIKQVKVI